MSHSRTKSARSPSLADRKAAAAKQLNKYITWTSQRPAPSFVFRGIKRDYDLTSKVGRDKSHYSLEKERQLLINFRRHALPHLNGQSGLNDWEILAIAQHHGLPTRLLDWTTNALVAAYFANEQSESDDDGIVHALELKHYEVLAPEDQTKDPLSRKSVAFLHPPALAPRIVSQRGLFSVHPQPKSPFKPSEGHSTFRFQKSQKLEMLRLLHRLGVDRHSVMGDLDGLAATLKWRYETGMRIE